MMIARLKGSRYSRCSAEAFALRRSLAQQITPVMRDVEHGAARRGADEGELLFPALRDMHGGRRGRDVFVWIEFRGAPVVAPARVGPQRGIASGAIEVPARASAGHPHGAAHAAIDGRDVLALRIG